MKWERWRVELIDVVSAPYDVDGHQIVVGLSVGISVAPTDGRDADALIKNADLALYRAKEEGRGTFRYFESGMDARAQARRVIELDMRAAVRNGEFELNYQPILQAESGEITGFEALVRWRHPQRGLISPADFIPLAEFDRFDRPARRVDLAPGLQLMQPDGRVRSGSRSIFPRCSSNTEAWSAPWSTQ